jgi:hypothetical protein
MIIYSQEITLFVNILYKIRKEFLKLKTHGIDCTLINV